MYVCAPVLMPTHFAGGGGGGGGGESQDTTASV